MYYGYIESESLSDPLVLNSYKPVKVDIEFVPTSENFPDEVRLTISCSILISLGVKPSISSVPSLKVRTDKNRSVGKYEVMVFKT